MISYKDINGVPNFIATELDKKNSKYCICIPIINEADRILKELDLGLKTNINQNFDIIICDGGSSDGSTEIDKLRDLKVNALLVKQGSGKQGAQLRMGFWWAINRGYEGIITIDGNNKDRLNEVPLFVEKLEQGFDYIQGSRFIKGGYKENTPLSRLLAVRFIHSPVISITARTLITDSTNNFRAYSIKYLTDPRVSIFRDIFNSYELLAYLSVRASQLGYKVCEVPVSRVYPKSKKTPTKISFIKGNYNLMKILFLNLLGKYNP